MSFLSPVLEKYILESFKKQWNVRPKQFHITFFEGAPA